MTATLLSLAAGALFGFPLGLVVGRARRGRLAFVAHFLREEVEALNDADHDAGVARERARRMPERQAEIDDPELLARMVGMTEWVPGPAWPAVVKDGRFL